MRHMNLWGNLRLAAFILLLATVGLNAHAQSREIPMIVSGTVVILDKDDLGDIAALGILKEGDSEGRREVSLC